MAQPPNNVFTNNVIIIPDTPVPSQPVGAPKVITLDFDTLGITDKDIRDVENTIKTLQTK